MIPIARKPRSACFALALALTLLGGVVVAISTPRADAAGRPLSQAGLSPRLALAVPDPGDPSTGSHLDYVEDFLELYIPTRSGNQMWERTSGNSLDANWLIETPDCWAGNFHSCTSNGSTPGTSQLASMIEADIGNAERWVDITTLSQCIPLCPDPGGHGFPSGRMHQAIYDGLQTAANSHTDSEAPIEVRIMAGSSLFRLHTDDDYEKLFDNLVNRHRLRITVTSQRIGESISSWNHAKIIAVDGRTAITGGQNLWSTDYESDDPVADVSMRVRGPAAISAHDVVDHLWQEANCPISFTTPNRPGSECPTTHPGFGRNSTGSVEMISVASRGTSPWPTHGDSYPHNPTSCTGNYDYSADMVKANPDLLALWALIGSANDTVFISAQQLSAAIRQACSAHPVDEELYDLLAAKMNQGVRVRIIVSGAGEGLLPDYTGSNDTRLPDITRALFGRVAPDVICQNLELAPLRHNSGSHTWQNGGRIKNHAKVVSVDDQAFYIGSRNLYPAQLQEHGYIVENPSASSDLKRQYIDPIWEASRSAAVVDPDRGICNIAQMRQQVVIDGTFHHRSTQEDGTWQPWQELDGGCEVTIEFHGDFVKYIECSGADVYAETIPVACTDFDEATFCGEFPDDSNSTVAQTSFEGFNSFVHPDGKLVQQLVRNNTFFARRQITTSSWTTFVELDDGATVHAFRGEKNVNTGEYPNTIAAFNVYVDPTIDNIRQELVMTDPEGGQIIRERKRNADRSWTTFTEIDSNDAIYRTSGGLISGLNTFENPFDGKLTQQVVRTNNVGVDTVWSRDHDGSEWGPFLIEPDGGIDTAEVGIDTPASGPIQGFNFRMLPAYH